MRRVIASAMICVFCTLSTTADAAISLFFDGRGNPLPARPARQAGALPARAAQGSVPRGVRLPPDAYYTFFPVSGRTFSDVVASAEEAGPRRPSGLSWSFGLSFDYDASTETDEEDETVHALLDVYDVRFEYAITVTLPMLLDNTALNPVERDLWKRYLGGLVEKEKRSIEAIKDTSIQRDAEEALGEITYIIFDFTPGMDTHATIRDFMRDEALRVGREMARDVKRRLSSPAPGADAGHTRRADDAGPSGGAGPADGD